MHVFCCNEQIHAYCTVCVQQHVQLRCLKTCFLFFWGLVMSSASFEIKTYGCSQVIKRHLLFWTDTCVSDGPMQTELQECYRGRTETIEIICVSAESIGFIKCHYSVWVWRSCIQLSNFAWWARWRREAHVWKRRCTRTHQSTVQVYLCN